MLLVFGLHTTARLVARPVLACPHCGNRAPHEIVESVRRFSFFFLPLFRVGAARFVDICGVCGLETELTEAQVRSASADRISPAPQDAPSRGPQDRSVS
jgi:hypothetical protein